MLRAGQIQPGELDEMRPVLSLENHAAVVLWRLLGPDPGAGLLPLAVSCYDVADPHALLLRWGWIRQAGAAG